MSFLREKYKKEVVSQMMKDYSYKSIMMVPRLEKIVLNTGVGEAVQNRKALDGAVNDMTLITGKKPIITVAKNSIAGFKLREGMPIGCKTTLRGLAMYEFLERLFDIALPRVRDFRGVSNTSFDGRGNYTLGLKEQIIFPEIDYDKIDKIRGMDVAIVTSSNTDEEALALLTYLGMPFAKAEEN